MDPEWYDNKFQNRKLFNEGVKGNFVVTDIKRYYKNWDREGDLVGVLEHYRIPTQYCVETFEVYLEKV